MWGSFCLWYTDGMKRVLRCDKGDLIIILLLVLCAGLFATIVVRMFGPQAEPKKTELPTINLGLNDVTYEEFRSGTKDKKYKGNTVNFTVDGDTTTYEDVELKGRGNSTWGQAKSPFQLKFSEAVDLLDLGAAKKWVFLANFFDNSNLRNDIAFKLADMLDEEYATRGEFVKVMMGDDYLGIYYLTHKMEAKKGSVELQNKLGVLMEIDILHRDTEDCIDTKYGTCMTLKDPVADEDEEADIVQTAIDGFMDSYNRFEEAVRAKDWNWISEIVDTRSLAEYYIISEFANNPDTYDSSYYFYKDGPDDKIHAGPIWDYDYAFANHGWASDIEESTFSPYVTNYNRDVLKQALVAQEMYYLVEMPEFMEEVKSVYKEKMAGKSEEFLGWLKARAASIREESLNDADRWAIDGVVEDTDYLIDWIRRKYEYLEYTLGR